MAKEAFPIFSCWYQTPMGFPPLLLQSDGTFLVGLRFAKEEEIQGLMECKDLPCFLETKKWLDLYFSGKKPGFVPAFRLEGLTSFQSEVLEETRNIPYGETREYGQIASSLAKKQGVPHVSPQAVGRALGSNPLCLLIPCHRVVGKKGKMTGYAGGIRIKIALLKLEGSFRPAIFDPSLPRCSWCNPKNKAYVRYHDEEWGKPVFEDQALFERLILESFQAGLSWECILKKREAFRRAFDGFDWKKIAFYGEKKVEGLLKDQGIVRNRSKILAAISNAKVFDSIVKEFGSFYAYLKRFSLGKTYYETHQTYSKLSDALSMDLRKRGMRFMGTTTVYSFLQAIGIVNSHEEGCFLFQKNESK